jgi:D-alanine-D-alanine ligase
MARKQARRRKQKKARNFRMPSIPVARILTPAVAIVERCIVGDEYTVSVLQGEALPSIRIETPRVFYDYRAKYESDRTRYHCPGTDREDAEQQYATLALAAFAELGCSGWGRVDFMAGSDGQPLVLEVNTVPGMTSHSLVPMAAKANGIDLRSGSWRVSRHDAASRKKPGISGCRRSRSRAS